MQRGVSADEEAEHGDAPATMTVRINPLRGKIFSIGGVTKTTTLSEVKEKICSLKQIVVADQRLILRGKQPDGNWTMADLGIINGTELRLVADPPRRTTATSHRDSSRRK